MRQDEKRRPIKRLFIANRGEIARRIATTSGRLGIETVALTDRRVPPAYLADVVTHIVHVPEESPALYLNPEAMVALALEHGCDALHPGFGFLSENPDFARLVIDRGLTWVGPHADAIEAMASKAAARAWAVKACVPCIAGLSGFPVPTSLDGDFSQLLDFADRTGYPLLLKAAYGGGGKGMRLVHERGEIKQAALRAYSEAKNSFGNGSLICEQYLGAPRHVEVQILGDKHGRVVAVGDRDCSVQRRHQKIIEEAPAPELSPATRKALHEAAIRLAEAVGYDNAGTVEFLVDWSDRSRKAEKHGFYFLEMNTRLQVEHPVTEEVFGLDLVEWQLRIAQGEPLSREFDQLSPRGHSVEIRLYAEDVRKDFFPSPGPIAFFKPGEGPGIRWEIGLDVTDEVTGRFDPMIAKLVATGSDRKTALSRMADALGRTFIAGPETNLELLRELVTVSPFAQGPVTTHLIKDKLSDILKGMDERRAHLTMMAQELLVELSQKLGHRTHGQEKTLNNQAITQGIFGGRRSPSVGAQINESHCLGLALESSAAGLPLSHASAGHGMATSPDGKKLGFWYAAKKSGSTRHLWVSLAGCHFDRRLEQARASTAEGLNQDDQGKILAPVPGKVITVLATSGGQISSGDIILVLESMKMEFEVKAARDGVITTVEVKPGDQVTAGQVLASFA